MQKPCGKLGKAVVFAVLVGLTSCATPQAPGSSSQTDLTIVLETIKQHHADGKTTTLKGIGLITLPPGPPVVLDNAAVSLIPSTPELESALLAAHRKWREGRRLPVSETEFQATFRLLDRHVRTIQVLGYAPLLRFAETDDKGRFTFDGVPTGRWLLTAMMDSKISTILWAIPGDLEAAKTAYVHLSGANILLEGRNAAQAESNPR